MRWTVPERGQRPTGDGMRASSRRELGHDAAAPAPSAPHTSRVPEQPGMSTAALALQQAAGNRAVVAMLAPRATRALARCEGTCACGSRSRDKDEPAERDRSPGVASLARVADASRRAGDPSAAGQALTAGALRRAVAVRARAASD